MKPSVCSPGQVQWTQKGPQVRELRAGWGKETLSKSSHRERMMAAAGSALGERVAGPERLEWGHTRGLGKASQDSEFELPVKDEKDEVLGEEGACRVG